MFCKHLIMTCRTAQINSLLRVAADFETLTFHLCNKSLRSAARDTILHSKLCTIMDDPNRFKRISYPVRNYY